MASKYDATFQETSLLNLAYKGLYLLQAMGTFSKDNAFRDDISARMKELGSKIDHENPSEVNQGIFDAIGKLAKNEDGNFVDEKIIKPYYEATEVYFNAIQPMALRKEKFDNDFFAAHDKVLESQSKAGGGYYDGEASLKALEEVSRDLSKNANLFSSPQRKLYLETLKKNSDAMNVITYLEQNDINKKLSGVQIDMQNLDKSYSFEGETTQEIFDRAALLVEQNNYEKAREVLADLELRDELRDSKTEKQMQFVKSMEANLKDSITAASKGEDGKEYFKNAALSKILTSDATINENFFKTSNFKEPQTWKNLYNHKLEALDAVVKDVMGNKHNAESILDNPEALTDFLQDLRGTHKDKGKTSNLFSTEDYKNSAKIENVVQKYINYLRQLNNSYASMFGEGIYTPSMDKGRQIRHQNSPIIK